MSDYKRTFLATGSNNVTLYQFCAWEGSRLYKSAVVDLAEDEPIGCIGCWDDTGPPTYVFPGEYLALHAEHDAYASLCQGCGETIHELYRVWQSLTPGINYHEECLSRCDRDLPRGNSDA